MSEFMMGLTILVSIPVVFALVGAGLAVGAKIIFLILD